MGIILVEPCLFGMAIWGKGWRAATETLGSGQTSPHFSTYSMPGICIALHLLHRWSASVSARCMVENAACLRTPSLQIFAAAMTGRGLLSTAARPAGEEADWFGTVGLILGCYCVCGAWKHHPREHTVNLTQGKKQENNMSSRSALPSGNDRSTGDHVSAITAYSLCLFVCMQKVHRASLIIKHPLSMCGLLHPLCMFTVQMRVLFSSLGERTLEVILDGC